MTPLFQRIRSKLIHSLPHVAITSLLLAGIVAITPTVASADHLQCNWQDAVDSGINNFLEKEPPKPVADTAFFNGEGEEVRLSDYRGTPLVMNFWATWCAPCVAEMPSLDRLKGLLADSGIDVLAIDEDRNGEKVVPKFYETNNIENLDILIDRKMALVKAAGISGLPTTLLIDAEGREVATVVGEAEWDSSEAVEFVKACLLPVG